MSALSDALAADRAGNLEAAAGFYEAAFASRSSWGAEPYLDFAMLLWQATDFGISTARSLRAGFVPSAGRRYPEVLAEARRAFPENTEIQFWQKYALWADIGEELSRDECQAFLERDPWSLMPVVFLFGSSDGAEYETEALELLRQCKEHATTRCQYAVSVLEGVLGRLAWDRRSQPQFRLPLSAIDGSPLPSPSRRIRMPKWAVRHVKPGHLRLGVLRGRTVPTWTSS